MVSTQSFIDNLNSFINLNNLNEALFDKNKIHTYIQGKLRVYRFMTIMNETDTIVYEFFRNLNDLFALCTLDMIFFINDQTNEETIYNMLNSAYYNLQNQIDNSSIELLKEMGLLYILRISCLNCNRSKYCKCF